MTSVAKSSYQKVPHVSRRLFTADRLYFNAQHLLVVESGYFQDTYRKIAFSDVCGLSICESKRAMVWGIVWILVATVFGILCINTDFQVPALIVISGLAVVALIVNIALGQSYRCTLSTAFSDVVLKTITRKTKAFQFKAFLDEKVSEVQGLLSQEAARELIESKIERSRRLSGESVSDSTLAENGRSTDAGLAGPPPLEPPGFESEAVTNAGPPPLPAAGKLAKRHWAFSIALGLLGVSSLGNYFFPWYTWAITGLIFAASMVISIFASIRKIDTEQGASLRNLFNAGIGFHFVVAIAGYVFMMGNAYSNPEAYEANPFGMYQLNSPIAGYMFLIAGIIALLFSLIAAVKMLRLKD